MAMSFKELRDEMNRFAFAPDDALAEVITEDGSLYDINYITPERHDDGTTTFWITVEEH